MRLLHVTVETGHRRESPAGEIAPGVLDWLRPFLAEAVRLSAEHPGVQALELDSTGWHVSATREAGGALRLSLWRAALPIGAPHVTGTLAVDGDTATLRVAMAGLARLPASDVDAAALEAGDLERCLAWAWLTRDRRH
ncbi:MAG: hypothetical protein F4010_04060 [Cenarchaeum sp. SB0669_bin_11]|nr:hypothetical protein [Cenarchaeum sp. SB0669_bin_11]